jgi:2-polyprenyl-3-methyl-5-hydroxy-6-metoxy-1,4-benzoquinol methylase
MDDLLKSGDYARKQIYCPSGLVRWSHGSRFELARALVSAKAGGRLLDYGCGDGTFVAMVHADFTEAVGLDVDPKQILECHARLGHLPGVRFEMTPPLAGQLPASGSRLPAPGLQLPAAGAWDVVTCMEVLEHCLVPERLRVIDALARFAAPSGLVVVSVPIEIGPSLAAKQLARAVAGWRGHGDYRHRERYSPVELLKSTVGAAITRVPVEGRGPDGPYRYYGHKGFDYRDVGRELSERFTIARRIFTPMRMLGPVLNSQAWFVCTPR